MGGGGGGGERTCARDSLALISLKLNLSQEDDCWWSVTRIRGEDIRYGVDYTSTRVYIAECKNDESCRPLVKFVYINPCVCVCVYVIQLFRGKGIPSIITWRKGETFYGS